MTSLLPPNLLKLFAPRPPVPYLKPLVKDDAKRGPNKQTGVGQLITRLRTEADEEEIQQGLRDDANAVNGKQPEGTKMEPEGKESEIKEEGAGAGAGTSVRAKVQPKTMTGGKKRDPIKEAGIVGEEAVKMRAEARRKRKEEYKKNAEENCESCCLHRRYHKRLAKRGPGLTDS
jgi:U1 small nuclear ribonucleoprotein